MAGDKLSKNLEEIRARIKQAAERSGRKQEEIELIAVSKNHPVAMIEFFREKGVNFFGENRVQELLEKDGQLAGVNWHFIGHLQRNKVKQLLRLENCRMIHSLDSLRLAREINQRAEQYNKIIPVLIEVNVAGDLNKFGLAPNDVFDFVQLLQQFKNIELKGLMTIAPYVANPEKVRPFFQKLSLLREQLWAKGYHFKELSMGMTNDYEVAIEEGSTMIRIGSGLFE